MTTSFSVDPGGSFTGTLDIDIGTLLGVQKVELTGTLGTQLVTYIADGTNIDSNTRRGVLASVVEQIVPLAQTFKVDEDRYIAGVDLKIITKGATAKDIIVQIRETASGIPTGDVLAESTIAHGSLTTGWNSFTFPPVFVKSQIEYAICVISGSDEHTLAVATIGHIDSGSGDAVTKQSFKQGNLLTSSNGVNYSIHQTRDLTFRIKGCVFSPTTKTINLGDVSGLSNVSDVAIFGGIEIPSRDCSLDFTLTDPDSTEYTLDKDQVLTLAAKKSGTFNLKANLTGTSKLSPVLFNNTQLITGEVASSGAYYSRMLETPADWDLTVKVEFKKVGNGAITVKAVESDGGGGSQETALSLEAGTKITADGWEYRIYSVTDLAPYTSGSISGGQIKIEATGGVGDRVYIRNVVGIVVDGA